ncbi:hypothetical protein [Hansschlegelia zhihuaiae]|uniref:Uncharacterized protein n=1 Tax=Hansschlegelia zhihuaiae TaxID=405005 RepID=A0A4V1KJB9_9HYPH|nr:hypothetical protein [Hansschlegelia zhihuaiae]RXF73652.1 hypothetical protein EK403_08600 [Hansschlegelia zhihuaiae]
MRTLAALTGAAALSVAAVAPAAAETLFVGSAMVTARTAKCGDAIAAGDFGRMTYRPVGVRLGNDGSSYLLFVTSRASYGMSVPNNQFQLNVNYGGQSINSQLSVTPRTGGVTQWVQAPRTIGPATPGLEITGSIANFFAIKGCTVTFQANLLNDN